MRNREQIRSYGDEKEMLEGDFYKPEKPESPFFIIDSSTINIENKTGVKCFHHLTSPFKH